MVDSLDREASKLGMTRQSVIKAWLAETDRKSNRNNTIIASFLIINNMLIVIRVGAYTGPVDRDFSL
jgi:hypothetical protein